MHTVVKLHFVSFHMVHLFAFFSGIMLVFCRLAQVHLPICRQVSMAVQLVLLLTTLHIPLVAFVIPSIMANLIMANSLGICSL
jgi:uncharacterized protein with PQ loop repeat